ncbi:LIM domain-binding protein 3-like, partial [Oncorhynchus masou masou]|uniref:LIM domain-binding protein 3-like n=1 Tax=Oncorhynchus masou masou TaxID=90313 RepID=UPI003182C9B1
SLSLSITPGTMAAEGSLIQGDNIVSIDGLSTEEMTHLEAQNKIKMSSNKLNLTLSRSKRPVPVPMAMPRMDSSMPVIPHQKIIANTAGNQEYLPNFKPIALKDSSLSTNKPIEVRGPGGKATIIHAQYNTPISMFSQDAIMDAIAGQSQSKGHDGIDSLSFSQGELEVKGPRFHKLKNWPNGLSAQILNIPETPF